jgi:hypothetical protein
MILQIRRATLDDPAAMYRVIQESFARYLTRLDIPPRPMMLSEEDLAQEQDAWVAELGGDVVGLAILHPGPARITSSWRSWPS